MKEQNLHGTAVDRYKASAALDNEALQAVVRLGIDVEHGSGSRHEFVGPAEVITDISLSGLMHISQFPIDRFQKDKIGPNGKFGSGVYFAAGSLTGETYDLLMTRGNTAHRVNVSGTIMIVDRHNIKELEIFLKHRAGVLPSRLKTNIQNADIAGLSPDGVDILLVFMDTERTAAEVVVLPHAVDGIDIQERKTIE